LWETGLNGICQIFVGKRGPKQRAPCFVNASWSGGSECLPKESSPTRL